MKDKPLIMKKAINCVHVTACKDAMTDECKTCGNNADNAKSFWKPIPK